MKYVYLALSLCVLVGCGMSEQEKKMAIAEAERVARENRDERIRLQEEERREYAEQNTKTTYLYCPRTKKGSVSSGHKWYATELNMLDGEYIESRSYRFTGTAETYDFGGGCEGELSDRLLFCEEVEDDIYYSLTSNHGVRITQEEGD